MERIVLGISAINFNNSNEFVTEKPGISSAGIWPNATFPCNSAAMATEPAATDTQSDVDSSDSASPMATTSQSFRRSLPSRLAKCKENSSSLMRIKRRSIMKPRRNLAVCDAATMRPADIRKLYLVNKIKGNFRPSNLETIYEEPTPDKNERMCFIGAKKIRRSLSCSDGLNVTKTTVKSRRLKIKKTFGRRFALKKISLEDFIDRLNASFEERPARQAIPTEDEGEEDEEATNKTDDDDDDVQEEGEEADMECTTDEALLLT